MPDQARRHSRTRTPPRRTTPQVPGADVQPLGNAAAQQALKVQGPLGRVFNRILGLSDNATDSAGMAFTKDQLQTYLDKKLSLAEGEWFRGKKLSGAAEALMKSLDADKDGLVGWPEFQTFRARTLQTVAPGVGPESSEQDVEKSANARFDKLDRSADGSLDYTELNAGTRAELPPSTKHKDLVAQLAARMVLDTVDTDQRAEPVKERDVSRKEWTRAAKGLQKQRDDQSS